MKSPGKQNQLNPPESYRSAVRPPGKQRCQNDQQSGCRKFEPCGNLQPQQYGRDDDEEADGGQTRPPETDRRDLPGDTFRQCLALRLGQKPVDNWLETEINNRKQNRQQEQEDQQYVK